MGDYQTGASALLKYATSTGHRNHKLPSRQPMSKTLWKYGEELKRPNCQRTNLEALGKSSTRMGKLTRGSHEPRNSVSTDIDEGITLVRAGAASGRHRGKSCWRAGKRRCFDVTTAWLGRRGHEEIFRAGWILTGTRLALLEPEGSTKIYFWCTIEATSVIRDHQTREN